MTDLAWDFAEAVNIGIAAFIGLILSYVAAYTYEQLVNRRRQREQRDWARLFESYGDAFDWQHYDIIAGKIADQPKKSWMKLTHRNSLIFDMQWTELGIDGAPAGDGVLMFDESRSRGKLYFFTLSGAIDFAGRDFVIKTLDHNSLPYLGIFIDAHDQGTRYVMMRRIGLVIH